MNKLLTLLPLAALIAATAIGTAGATGNQALPRHDDGPGHHDGRDDDSGCDSAEDRAERQCAPAAASTAAVAGKRLIGTVGPGFTIKLKTGKGAPARAVPAGTYTIVVRDQSDEHNFRLRGRGINKATPLGWVGATTWRVRLARGTYRYVCDPHAPMMKGTLIVR